MTLVDTNILLDLLTDDPQWAGWSTKQLDAVALRGPLAINDVVYAELSAGFTTIEALDAALTVIGITHTAMPRPALFLAGKAFQRYRASGGTKTGVLSDACGDVRGKPPHAGCPALSNLFPDCRPDRASIQLAAEAPILTSPHCCPMRACKDMP